MAKRIPVIARAVDLVRWFAGIKAGKHAELPELEGWVWPKSAHRQVAAGELEPIDDSDGVVIAYQRKKAPARIAMKVKPAHVPGSFPSEASPVSISAAEMTLYAGRHFPGGKSRTAGMGDVARECRVSAAAREGRRVPAEDRVELVVAKVGAFGPCVLA